VNWQVNYALEIFNKQGGPSTAEHIDGDTIKILTPNRPDVLALILADDKITEAMVSQYHQKVPELDFLCGYRKTCIWEGGAIKYLEESQVGWGTFGTLASAASDGTANTASHKEYFFSDRLIKQYGPVQSVEREFDRIYHITLRKGQNFKLAMILEYEPTADAVRSLWQSFGPVDVIWNINPNGNPTKEAIQAGHELGCEVLKWYDLKEFIRNR